MAEKSKATIAPPLTVENVCEAVQGVEWTFLALRLIPDSKYREIKQLPDTSNENRLRLVVECWLGGGEVAGQAPSWRRLILALDDASVPNNIRHYAEPVQDPTLTVENVTKEMGGLGGWENVGNWLKAPHSKLIEMKKSSKSTEQERCHSLIEYWVNTHPDASWENLADQLYVAGQERVAAAIAKQYLPEADPTLTTDNLMEVVKEEEHRWDIIGQKLGVKLSKRQEIKRLYNNNHLRMEAVLVLYVRNHPTASWKKVAAALKGMGLLKLADEVITKFVRGVKDPSPSTNPSHPPPSQASEQLSQVEEPSLSTDQSHPAFSLPSQQISQAAARDKLLIQRHIEQQGSLNMNSLKMLLCGLPRTGKTTAMRRLSNQLQCLDPNDSPIPSTGFEKPKTVELYKKTVKQSVMITGMGQKAEWKYQNLVQQGETLYSRILKSSSNNTHSPSITSSSSQIVVASSSGAEKQSQHTAKEDEDVWPSQSSCALDQEQAVLTSLVKAQDWKTVREKLKAIEDVTILHMMDCGGHPECHEILTLLLEGRALSLLFLNLTHDLDKTYHVVFQGKEGTSSIQYESVLTPREVLQRILCSISSLQSGAHKERPVALLVGSYLDETDQEKVLALDKSVQEALKSFIKKDILFPADVNEGKYIATLDNMSEDQEDIEELRKVILTIIETRFRAEPVPTAWLLLHLLLRAKYENERGWCSVEECVEVAMACGIKSEELLKKGGFLHYIHKHYGTLLYYPKVAGLCNKVICDPNIILHPFTRTFLFAFACNPGHVETAKSIRASGEIPHDLMETVCATQSADPIPTSEIIALLKDRYILYESVRTAAGTSSYFMPCLLQPDPTVVEEASSPTTLASLNPAPLQLVPNSAGFVPLGLFPAMVVKMSHTWDFENGERFSNRIQFKVRQEGKPTRRVEFRQLPSSLELRLLHKETRQGMDLSVLNTCRQQLWKALCEISSEYPHMQDVVWRFGFYCPGGLQPGGQPHSAVCRTNDLAPLDMECIHDPHCTEDDFLLEDKHMNWFKNMDQGGGSDLPLATDFEPKELHTSATSSSQPLSSSNAPRPTLKDLVKVRVKSWYNLGLQLDIEDDELDTIERNHPQDWERCKRNMFKEWLRKCPQASYQQLVQAMVKSGDVSEAHCLCRKYGIDMPQ